MPTAATSISWLGALGWLTAIAAASFLVAWVLTNRLGMRRTPYIGALALLTGGLTRGYLAWSDTSLTSFATDRWGWGLVGAAVTGAILARLSRHQPSGPRPQGWRLATTLAWEGIVYGPHPVAHRAQPARHRDAPYATGGAHIVPLGHQRPAAKTATPVP
jgi:hypothetical protein